jgi:hypothetical protein
LATGVRATETKSINRSLASLADVFLALATRASHVPTRNSKLTHLLADSFGGNSKTLMMVCLHPDESRLSETIHALQFAARVKTVSTDSKASVSKP